MANINKLFNRKDEAIKFTQDYIQDCGSMILEAKRKAAEEEPKLKPSKGNNKRKKSPSELREEFINEIKWGKKYKWANI